MFAPCLLATLLVTAPESPQFAKPIRVIASENLIYVANAENGTLDTLNSNTLEVQNKRSIAGKLSDLVKHPENGFVAIDPVAETVVQVSLHDNEDKPDTLKLSRPERVAVAADGKTAYVTSRWGKRVDVIGLNPLKRTRSVSLPFQPLMVATLPDKRVVVADAFGGQLAILSEDGESISTFYIRGHNIRGLLAGEDELLVVHQRLSATARTDFSDVHWGSLIQSLITRIPVSELGSVKPRTQTITLSDVEHGAADPSSIARLSDGRLIVLFSGVNEVLVSPAPGKSGRVLFEDGLRFDVGPHPTQIAVAPDESQLYITNSLGDSLTVVPIPMRRTKPWEGRVSPNESGVPKTIGGKDEDSLTEIQRGERAFFSGNLSHDGWLSCNSCHIDGHTPGQLADTFGDNSFGAAKLIPTLLGVGETGPWGWSGNFESLEDQVHKSLQTTMHSKAKADVAADIAAYLRSLKPPPAAETKLDASVIATGRIVFETSGCMDCHQTNLLTSDKVVDVGFRDGVNQTQFNPPSLRSVGQRRTFFHDGRAKSIGEAIKLHLAGLKKELSPADQTSLREYLLSL
jgi:DNA-binding beta-propeller fold protein YncE